MKKFPALLELFIAAALILAARPGRADPAVPRQRENRFLFIVDTSAAMRGSSNEVVQNVVELMESDLRGEFRQGDTIGLWTFSDKLYPEFPMQIWSRANKDNIVADVAAFLEGRSYGKRAHFDKVMPALNQVIKNSQRITVVLFSEGAGVFEGTPFDKEINALQKKFAHEFRATDVPFVTVLAARNGDVFTYTVNYPGLVAIPHTANPEPPPVTNAPVVAVVIPETNIVVAPPPPPKPLRSLILTGHKEKPVVEPPPEPVTAPAPVPPATTIVAPAPAPAPVAAQAQTPAPQPTPVVAAPRQNPEPAPPAPVPVSPPAIASVKSPEPSPAPAVPPPAIAVAAAPSGGAQLPLFILAFSLLAIAIALLIFLIRRSRSAHQSSLITQSINRPR